MNSIQTVVTQETAKISCNIDQVKAALQEKLSEYKDAVFTEESKQIAKKEVAALRAEKKDLQDRLRAEKKKYMEPWEAFESQVKELLALYDEPVGLINSQLQEFEEKRIRAKKELIHTLYDEIASGMQEYIPLQVIYNPKWENATVKEKDIRKEMEDITLRTRSDIQTIESMNSESVTKALMIYKRNLNLSESIAYINNYEQQKREIIAKEQERRQKEEQERIRREERERIEAEMKLKAAQEEAVHKVEEERRAALALAEQEKEIAVEQAKQEVIDSLVPNFEGEANLYEYRVSLTDGDKEKFEMFMDSIGIEWELI